MDAIYITVLKLFVEEYGAEMPVIVIHYGDNSAVGLASLGMDGVE